MGGCVVAVIPTVVVGGPLALLAVLFPAAFGGWRRWLTFLTVASGCLTLFGLQWWFAAALAGSRWGAPQALWTAMGLLSIAGVAWAWRRHERRVRRGEAPLLPSRAEFAALLVSSVVGFALMLAGWQRRQPLSSPLWLPVVAFILASWGGLAHAAWARLRGARLVPAAATEAVVLTWLALAVVALAPLLEPRVRPETKSDSPIELVWTFRLPGRGAIASSPVVAGDRVLIAVAFDDLFRPHGALYCLDRGTGAVIWSFSDDRKMKPVFSTPAVSDGRVYVGEGFHQDEACKVYCVNLADGRKLWEHQTAGHTESGPTVADGRVYIGAGDDGVRCLDAETGKRIWGFGGYHVDADPAVHAGRVFVGSGVGDTYKRTAVLCLDAAKGKPIWRYPTTLPVWSRAAVANGSVFVASGNGRMNEAADAPAGEVLRLGEADGALVWRRRLPDGALGRLAIDGVRVYAGCRDGFVYALRRGDGEIDWRREIGGPVGAGLVLAGRLYAVSVDGALVCLEPATGRVVWSVELAGRGPVEVISTPALDVREASRRLYVGVTMVSAARAGELRCFEEHK